MLDLVARHDRIAIGRDADQIERRSRGLHARARRDRPRDARGRERGEQLARTRQRHDVRCAAQVRLGMRGADALDALFVERDAGLAQQHVDQQAAAHADAAMHAPDRQVNAVALERLVPREHVLVDAVDERAVEIEQECGLAHHSARLIAKSG